MRLVIVSDIHDHALGNSRRPRFNPACRWTKGRRTDGVICCGDDCSPFVPRLIARALADRPVPVVLVWGNN